jgi:hypothetical protein
VDRRHERVRAACSSIIGEGAKASCRGFSPTSGYMSWRETVVRQRCHGLWSPLSSPPGPAAGRGLPAWSRPQGRCHDRLCLHSVSFPRASRALSPLDGWVRARREPSPGHGSGELRCWQSTSTFRSTVPPLRPRHPPPPVPRLPQALAMLGHGGGGAGSPTRGAPPLSDLRVSYTVPLRPARLCPLWPLSCWRLLHVLPDLSFCTALLLIIRILPILKKRCLGVAGKEQPMTKLSDTPKRRPHGPCCWGACMHVMDEQLSAGGMHRAGVT